MEMRKDALIARLREAQGERSLRDFASEVNCSAMYLSQVYSGEREPGGPVLDYLGLEREVTVIYRPRIKTRKRWR